MCGRYSVETRKFDFARELGAESLLSDVDPDFEEFFAQPHYNIAPSLRLPILQAAPLRGTLKTWGGKIKVQGSERFLINARAESLWKSPLWKRAATSPDGRCVVPATGWYEWKRDGSEKWPYHLTPETDGLLYFGGLVSQKLDAFVIVTTEAGPDVSPIHHREPVILQPDELEAWIQGGEETIQDLTQPLPKGHVTTRKLESKLVNSPKNNGPEVLI